MDEQYKIYLDERKLLIDARFQMSNAYDKTILALSSSALGFSLAFVHQIAPVILKNSFPWLIATWSLITLSVILILTSFLTSQAACDKQLDILENQEPAKKIGNSWSVITVFLNIFSSLAFVAGIISLVVFSAINAECLIHKEDQGVAEKDKTKITEGFIPPKAPKRGDTAGAIPPKPPKRPPVEPSQDQKK